MKVKIKKEFINQVCDECILEELKPDMIYEVLSFTFRYFQIINEKYKIENYPIIFFDIVDNSIHKDFCIEQDSSLYYYYVNDDTILHTGGIIYIFPQGLNIDYEKKRENLDLFLENNSKYIPNNDIISWYKYRIIELKEDLFYINVWKKNEPLDYGYYENLINNKKKELKHIEKRLNILNGIV